MREIEMKKERKRGREREIKGNNVSFEKTVIVSIEKKAKSGKGGRKSHYSCAARSQRRPQETSMLGRGGRRLNSLFLFPSRALVDHRI